MPRLKSGRRRRPVQVHWTDLAASAAAVPPPRRWIAPAPRRPPQPPRVIVRWTVQPTGGNGGNPAPVAGSRTPILIVRGRGRGTPRWPSTTLIRPKLGAVPNLPPPPTIRVRPWPSLVAADPRTPLRYRPRVVASLPSQRPGLPSAHIDVIPAARPLRWPWPSARHAALATRSIQFPRPPAIARVPNSTRRHPLPQQLDGGAGIRPILPARSIRIALVARPRPTPVPVRPIPVRAWTGAGQARMRQTTALIVRMPNSVRRHPLPLQLDSGTGYQTTQRRPLVIRPTPGLVLPPRLLGPVPRYRLTSPPSHTPPPIPGIGRQRRDANRRPDRLGWGAPHFPPIRVILQQPIPLVNPPTPGGPTVPPDLVAACIAWLRLQPAIVAALGDAAATPKFASDLEPRDIQPPYVAFAEPEEDEGYETADSSGVASSLSTGTLMLAVVGNQALGKLGTRQLAETVVAALNDAPLVFQDGVLVYLRRSERRFPTFRESGPGTNVVAWKRLAEMHYQIERWAPQF